MRAFLHQEWTEGRERRQRQRRGGHCTRTRHGVHAFMGSPCLAAGLPFIDGPSVYYYYTQWAFVLITVYFGLEVLSSFYGCYEYHHRAAGEKDGSMGIDAEQGAYPAPNSRMHSRRYTHASANITKNSIGHGKTHRTGSAWGYMFQIPFQMNDGAIVPTACVFWFIIVTFLDINMYNLSILEINMHSVNVVLLISDTALNSLWFPLFRISYFFIWTIIYVIFQWILHACISIWWPYPFLDLSTPFAPLRYFLVALMHFPCYGIFAWVIKLKRALLMRWFPQSYKYTSGFEAT